MPEWVELAKTANAQVRAAIQNLEAAVKAVPDGPTAAFQRQIVIAQFSEVAAGLVSALTRCQEYVREGVRDGR
jgi:hypothetical protein